jgi:hypothetical protein
MEPLDRLLGRRDFFKVTGVAGVSWLTAVSHILARAAERAPKGEPAQSIILLWMGGAPSQLETFDPHPGTAIGGDTRAIATRVKDVRLADGFVRLAEQMDSLTVIRSMVSKEGDHERGTYLMKTGYRPDPTIVHPSIGAICCKELPTGSTEIPRHVSIIPNQWPARGGFLGDEYDAFKTYDPAVPVPDVKSRTTHERDQRRLQDLDVVEAAFARGRRERLEATLHRDTIDRARKMMTSEQLRAFDIAKESKAVREAYGDTPFGRGCLAARRLIEVGIRCVEVTLDGWDSHVNNHKIQYDRVATLDPAFSALIKDLKERRQLSKTVVICAGEFGRTPQINPAGGRDHWTNGFSIALAGGGLRAGYVLGETDPEGKKDPTRPQSVADVHATVLQALGIDCKKVMQSNIGRTFKLSEGKPIAELVG